MEGFVSSNIFRTPCFFCCGVATVETHRCVVELRTETLFRSWFSTQSSLPIWTRFLLRNLGDSVIGIVGSSSISANHLQTVSFSAFARIDLFVDGIAHIVFVICFEFSSSHLPVSSEWCRRFHLIGLISSPLLVKRFNYVILHKKSRKSNLAIQFGL